VNIRKWLREPCPGDQLLRGHEVDIGQLEDGVDEPQESLLPVGSVEEPSSVEEEGEGGLRLGVVLQEVLCEDLLDFVGLLLVETTVSHRARSTPDILQCFHRHLPHSLVRVAGAGLDAARVRHPVLE